ncbi:MAG: D-alanine--D-alanine ligase, partial [Erysipelotrichaceae bacterium]|nr:D-alanine--D-alanine ligase [Erysipelotrichaceae bacterium]
MKMNVAVFMGGKSTEHEISCISASQVIKALDENKYEIIPVYIAKNNDLYTGDALLDISNFSDNIIDKLEKVCIYKDGTKVYVKPINGMFKKAKAIDVAFEVVHGTNCEDGTLSGFLEMLDIPYTGSDVLGSALGQDKAIMKEVFEHEGINIVDWFYILPNDYDLQETKKKAKKIGYPLIIKPANLGSSVGIEVIHSEDELKEKIKECSKYDFKLVIEKMVTDM